MNTSDHNGFLYFEKELFSFEYPGFSEKTFFCDGRTALSSEAFLPCGELRDRVVFWLSASSEEREEGTAAPGRSWLDLRLRYGLWLPGPDGGKRLVKLTDALLRQWESTEEELFSLAMRNTPLLLPERLYPLESYLTGLLPELRRDELPEEELFLLTNSEGFCGAGALLYSAKLRLLAGRLRRDLFLIPSSIHEILAFFNEEKVDGVKDKIAEINRTLLGKEEVLSDSMYRLCWQTGEVSLL